MYFTEISIKTSYSFSKGWKFLLTHKFKYSFIIEPNETVCPFHSSQLSVLSECLLLSCYPKLWICFLRNKDMNMLYKKYWFRIISFFFSRNYKFYLYSRWPHPRLSTSNKRDISSWNLNIGDYLWVFQKSDNRNKKVFNIRIGVVVSQDKNWCLVETG